MSNPVALNALVTDQNDKPVQIGSSFVTTNGSQNSPLSYTAATTAITVPSGAVEMILLPTTDLKVSEDSTMTTYDLIAGGTKESVPCARMETIYITRSSGNGTLYFRFTKV